METSEIYLHRTTEDELLRKIGQVVKEALSYTTESNSSNINGPDLIDRKEIKRQLGISDSTVRRWEKVGYLRPIAVGGKRYYRLEDVAGLTQNFGS